MGDFVSQSSSATSRTGWPKLAPDRFAAARGKPRDRKPASKAEKHPQTQPKRSGANIVEIVDMDDSASVATRIQMLSAFDSIIGSNVPSARQVESVLAQELAEPPDMEVSQVPEIETLERAGAEIGADISSGPRRSKILAFAMSVKDLTRLGKRFSLRTPHVEPRSGANTVEPSTSPAVFEREPILPRVLRASRLAGSDAAVTWRQLKAVSEGVLFASQSWLADKFQRRRDDLAVLAEAAKYRAVANRLNSAAVLSENEQQAVQAASGAVRKTYQASSEIAVEGEVTPRPMFIASGWACRCRVLADGRRQIIGLLVPGDGIGLRGCAEPLSATTILALTTVETIEAAPLLRLAEQPHRYPGIAHAMQRAAVQEEEFLINQVFRLGMLSPVERLGNLVMELQWRLEASGLATARELTLPVTYETLAEALSLPRKKVAAAMSSLRRQRLFKWTYGRATLSAPSRLRRLSQFKPPGTCTCGRMRLAPMEAV